MTRARWKQIVRRFPENGMKLLLEDPANVRDLLALTRSDLPPLIDFDRLSPVRTTFVARDFRHVEADVVLTAPLRGRTGPQRRTVVWLYLLLEHQSEPDALMPIRLLDYLAQILKAQLRAWSNTHDSYAGFRAQPIVPVVFYTGTERWDSPGRLVELVEQGERFARVTPDFEPLFLNLPALPAERLLAEGGYFGRVLRLVQRRKARLPEFRRLLEEAVQGLEAMPEAQRLRWLELLSYIHLLVYHERGGSEHRPLQEAIEASVQTDPNRQEVQAVKRTIAEEMQEKGRRKGRREGRQEGEIRARQQMLLLLLRRRFGEIPEETAAAINACRDVRQLDLWGENFAVAATLEDIGIESRS
jgi:predicted transposase YdaD